MKRILCTSIVLIMLLTFAELSVLFSLFGIENAVLKAGIIALLDILPILGTGGGGSLTEGIEMIDEVAWN